MKNLSQILRSLKKQGFTIEKKNSSALKVIPPNKNQKFYLLHQGEKCLHPLRRFAKNEWGVDINK